MSRRRHRSTCVGVFVASAFAFASPAYADIALEGESMTRSTTDTASLAVVADSAASGGKTLAFRRSPTSATASYATVRDGDFVSLRMRGTQCQGAPRADVSIDGVATASFAVSATSYRDYQLLLDPAGNGRAGSHRVTVAYGNNFASSSCDRNLYLDTITVREVASSAFEGETMMRSTSNTSAIGPAPDTTASAGAAMVFRTSPTWATRQYKTTVELGQMTLRMRGTQCQGAPHAGVSIDGSAVATVVVSSSSYRDYAVTLPPTSGAAGTHTVRVDFSNDLATSSCNRNLYLDRIAVGTTPDSPDLSQVGRWLPKFALPGVAIHMAMLPTGKVLYWHRLGAAFLLDPATHATRRIDAPANTYCAGHTFLADGRVLVTGGHVESEYGIRSIVSFDPFNERWATHPNMRRGRWYPSQVLLPDGRQLILSGTDENASLNPDIEVYSPRSDTVSVLGVRGGTGRPPNGWWYPHLFVMRSGRTLVAGPDVQDSWFVGAGATAPLSWQDVPNLPARRLYASGVLLPGGTTGSTRVLLVGGSTAAKTSDRWPDVEPSRSSVVLDETNASAGWRAGPPLVTARAHHNTVLLPDGSMVTVGGGYGQRNGNLRAGNPDTHRRIELYDPATQAWKLGPAQDELRTYHSTAVLLPDGRVLSAGDDGYNGTATSDTGEIYEPPYLFKGPRPTIVDAPGHLLYRTTYRVRTGEVRATRAVLVAPGATTHSADMNQRYVPLAVRASADGADVDVVSPPNANVAPPGYYMLFLLSEAGVPSRAKFVHLG